MIYCDESHFIRGNSMKKRTALAALFLLAGAAAFCQSADSISELLQTEDATYGQAAYLAAVYSGSIAEDASADDAFAAMVDAGYIAANRDAESAIPLKELAKLYAGVTGVRGGLFYTLTHAPRYAFRELKARGVMPQSADPSQHVSGRNTLAVLNGCIKLTEASGGDE